MVAILVVMLVSVSVSFLCSLWEAALYAIPPSRLQALADAHVAGAKRLQTLRQDIERPISAILTFNTIANTVGAAIFGALVGKEFGPEHPMVLVAAGVFTIVILVFSEIIPKTLGVHFADKVAPKSAFIIQILITVLGPFVLMSQYLTRKIKQAGAEQKKVDEADIISLVKIAEEEGTLKTEEARWVVNALRLKEKTAHELMTPRTVVYRLPAELPLSMVTTHSEHWTHSRLPLCKDNDPDRVTGIVYRREVFDALISREQEELPSIQIQELAHEAQFIPETLPANQLLARFLQTREHMFIVTNEHGGMEGVITLEDVLEDLIGEEIVDMHDKYVDMQEYARRLARKRRFETAGPGEDGDHPE